MKLSEAVAIRLGEIMAERGVTQYRLSILSGVAQSTISYLRNGKTQAINLVAIHEIMDGLGMELAHFFDSPLFKRDNLE